MEMEAEAEADDTEEETEVHLNLTGLPHCNVDRLLLCCAVLQASCHSSLCGSSSLVPLTHMLHSLPLEMLHC